MDFLDTVGKYSARRDNKTVIYTTPQTRRSFVAGLTTGLGLPLGGCTRTGSETASTSDTGKADVTLRIGPVLVDIAKDHTISTVG